MYKSLFHSLPREVLANIMSWYVCDSSSLKPLQLVCREFHLASRDSRVEASRLLSLYGVLLVYEKTRINHLALFKTHILSELSTLTGGIPYWVYLAYTQDRVQDDKTANYLKKNCVRLNDTVDCYDELTHFLKTYNRDTNIMIRSFLSRTRYVPAYSKPMDFLNLINSFPLNIFEHDPAVGNVLTYSSSLDEEKRNSVLVNRLMWEYGFVRNWTVEEKQRRIDIVMKNARLKLEGLALREMIKRNAWVNWSDELKSRGDPKQLRKAAAEAVEELLQSGIPALDLAAHRITGIYNIVL